MKNKDNIKRIMKIICSVLGGTLMATSTVAVIYATFFLLKIITFGIFTVSEYLLHFIVTNWKSGLGVIAILTVGVIEWELVVLPKVTSFFKKSSSNSDSDSDLDADSDADSDSDEDSDLNPDPDEDFDSDEDSDLDSTENFDDVAEEALAYLASFKADEDD